jgi:hypothetical protein
MALNKSNRVQRILGLGGLTAALSLSIAILASNLQSSNSDARIPENTPLSTPYRPVSSKQVESELVQLGDWHETGIEQSPKKKR